jgi:hypothetical protein
MFNYIKLRINIYYELLIKRLEMRDNKITNNFVLRYLVVILFLTRPFLLIFAGLVVIYLTNPEEVFSMKKQFNQLSRDLNNKKKY